VGEVSPMVGEMGSSGQHQFWGTGQDFKVEDGRRLLSLS
jgi:hypothetical protein